MGTYIAARIRKEVAKLDWAFEDLQLATGWTAHRTRQILDGKGRPIDDFEALRLAVLFKCTPARIYHGADHIHGIPLGQRGPFETLESLWTVILEQELTQELEAALANRVLGSTVKKRTNRGVSRSAVYDEFQKLVGECSLGGICHCGLPGGRDGECPYRNFEE